MIADAFKKFADNAPDFPVYAKFDGHDHETLEGSTCIGWYSDEAEAEEAAERARSSIGCQKAIVVPKRWLIPAFAATILYFDRIIRGDQFDRGAAMQDIIDEHCTWPFALSLVLIEPMIEAVREERLRQHAAQKPKRRPAPRLPTLSTSSTSREAATC